MAMSASHLSSVMRAAIAAKSWANDGPELTELCDAIAAAVVAEVQAAVITIPAGATSFGLTTTPGNPVGPVPAPIVLAGTVS